jgi:bleomycin hydrolase
MKRTIACLIFFAACFIAAAQPAFSDWKTVPVTPVKNQAMTGTCWCFSTISLIESETLRSSKTELDLSEMFIVRNIYLEKARNYVLRQGKAQFSEGALGHDLVRGIATYGAMPESVYSGLQQGQKAHNHAALSASLKRYLDSILQKTPLPANWMEGYTQLLDRHLGTPPYEFEYNGRSYSPKTFAKDVLHFEADQYVNITSLSHHPYYSSFVLEVPDNFSNGSYFNLPLDELQSVVKEALNKGFSVMWDADVSNNGFRQEAGVALFLDAAAKPAKDLDPDTKEQAYNAILRQQLFESLVTQDDHLMHIVGLSKSPGGKTFYKVKNSWGAAGPLKGYIQVSEAYFGINTISVIVPRAALSKELLAKMEK